MLNHSFEFFPPKTPEGEQKLLDTCKQLSVHQPEFVSVTFGAGGSTQVGTLKAVQTLLQQGYATAPHVSCVGFKAAELEALLKQYLALGVKRIVALRGDLPSGMVEPGDFKYASELVQFVRSHVSKTLHIEVAAYPETHPQAKTPHDDIAAFLHKVRCGANSAITQYFYNVDAFLYFRDAIAKESDIPIVPGIMPITNHLQLARFSDACGAEIPRWIRQRLQSFGDDKASIVEFGTDVVASQCQRLTREGVNAFHFYTLNQAGPTMAILQQL